MTLAEFITECIRNGVSASIRHEAGTVRVAIERGIFGWSGDIFPGSSSRGNFVRCDLEGGFVARGFESFLLNGRWMRPALDDDAERYENCV